MINVRNQRRLNDACNFLNGVNLHNRRTLEIGCGSGEVAEILKTQFKLGEYDGLDVSNSIVESLFLDNKIRGDLLDVEQQLDSSYAFIVCLHTLEHIRDAKNYLRAAANLLDRDGLLFVEVPNRSGHPGIRFEENFAHEHQFSVQSLTKLFAHCGLDVLKICTGAYYMERCVDTIQVLACPKANNDFSASTFLHNIPKKIKADAVVVFGAGMPSLAEIDRYIPRAATVAVVDSNHALHESMRAGYIIKSPDLLDHADFDAIFINSLAFEAEIQQQITRYGKPIFTLRDVLQID